MRIAIELSDTNYRLIEERLEKAMDELKPEHKAKALAHKQMSIRQICSVAVIEGLKTLLD